MSKQELEATSVGQVVLLDFYAEWCSPCKAIAPFLPTLETEFGVKVVKVDVDQSQDDAVSFGVRAVPTFVLLRDGAEVARQVGGNPVTLKAFVRSNV